MEEIIFKIIYMILYLTAVAIRAPFARKSKRIKNKVSKKIPKQVLLLSISSVTMILPLIYIFTGWLDAFNMNLPLWLRLVGMVVFAFAVFLHSWSHIALNKNFSPLLEIKENHELIMNGPYKYVRHPMYASFFIWALSQGVALSNYAVLVLGAVSLLIVYFARIEDEEQMMIEEFGNKYKEYMKRTGRLVPKF